MSIENTALNFPTMKRDIVNACSTLTDQLAGLRHDRDDINARIKEKVVELNEATKLQKALTRTRRTK